MRVLVPILLLLIALPAAARNANDRYGEVKLSRLHPEATRSEASLTDRAQVSKVPWVGSWWAYSHNGIANCWDASRGETCYQQATRASPASKLDDWLGRTANIERTALTDYTAQVGSLGTLATEKRNLVTTLNRWIAANPGQSWRDTADGKRYLEVVAELDTARQSLPSVALDTATEFEVIKHGTGVEGVEGWWGHCNAWAASAIMDPEPRHDTSVDGITFTAADVKAYLTEAWMEHRSSFFGDRAYEDPFDSNGDGKIDWSDADAGYKDLTPASFHIFTAHQLGNKDKSFVIDRYTGSQVWNQPMRGYHTEMKPLYQGDAAVDRDVLQTTYGGDGKARVASTGTKKVYPVMVTTVIHWMTDGLPHDVVTVENINELDEPSDMGNAWTIRSRYHDQVEVRTLTYELWLSATLGDSKAEILGDGEWKHGSMVGNANHPDFAWQPISQHGSRRDYENPHVPYDKIVAEILPGTLKVPDPGPGPSGLTFEASVGEAIPDDDTTGISSVITVSADAEITSLVVVPNITHTYRADLEVTLRKGRRWKILKRKGDGGSADDLKDAIDVPHFVGDRTAGEWKLVVKDLWAQDKGTLEGWTISFNQ